MGSGCGLTSCCRDAASMKITPTEKTHRAVAQNCFLHFAILEFNHLPWQAFAAPGTKLTSLHMDKHCLCCRCNIFFLCEGRPFAKTLSQMTTGVSRSLWLLVVNVCNKKRRVVATVRLVVVFPVRLNRSITYLTRLSALFRLSSSAAAHPPSQRLKRM